MVNEGKAVWIPAPVPRLQGNRLQVPALALRTMHGLRQEITAPRR